MDDDAAHTTTQQTAEDDATPKSFLRLICSKAIDVRETERGVWVLADVFGVAAGEVRARTPAALAAELFALANVQPLADAEGRLFHPARHERDGPSLPWALEEPLVARIPDSYRIWLCGRGDHRKFDFLRGFLPLAYLEDGFGKGSRDGFEQIHQMMVGAAREAGNAITQEMLMAFLHHVHLRRLCDDLLALVDRSVTAFHRVLKGVRVAVRSQAADLRHLGVSEIEHGGPLSIDIATHVTIAVISIVSSLDVMTKLVKFVNETSHPTTKFRPPGTTYYADLAGLRARTLAPDVLQKIQIAWSSATGVSELVQFRHDLIHSTTALEIERCIYIGCATSQVKELPLHYAQLPARDVAPNGQPLRFLGREYFTAQDRSFDEVLFGWIASAIGALATTVRELWAFIDAARPAATHTLAGT